MNGKPKVLCDYNTSPCLSSAAVCSTEQIKTASKNNNLIDGHVSPCHTVKQRLFIPFHKKFVLFETTSDKLCPRGRKYWLGFLGCDNQPGSSLEQMGWTSKFKRMVFFTALPLCKYTVGWFLYNETLSNTDPRRLLYVERQIVVFEWRVIHKDHPLWSFFVLQLTII